MLDTESGKVVTTVPIGEHVDGCAFDEATQLAFASCGEGVTTIAKEEAPDKLTVVQTLKTERGARTIALDPAHASDLFADGEIRAGTDAGTGRAALAGDHPEFDEAAGIRAG